MKVVWPEVQGDTAGGMITLPVSVPVYTKAHVTVTGRVTGVMLNSPV